MRMVFGLAVVCAACLAAACGGSDDASKGGSSDTSGGADGEGGADSVNGTGNSSTGNAAGVGASDAEGGAGSVFVPPPVVSMGKPHAAGGLVAGGVIAHSAHFTGVFSLGAAPGGNALLTSKTHQLRGGVIGASQK